MCDAVLVRTFAALLRGINVGGRTLVPMADLRALLVSIGLEDVTTYIQSGNVVFRTAETGTKSLTAAIERAVAERFGVDVSVLLRTPAQLSGLPGRNPFLPGGRQGALHVVFLDRKPKADAVAGLDPDRSPGDRWSVDGREIFLQLPSGSGRSKLTLDWFERRLGVRGTVRNWRTVLELISRTGG